MGYMHIENLYKNQDILEFKRCYAMEKIHGTSAHVAYRDGYIHLSPGGESLVRFEKCFDLLALTMKFSEKFTPLDTVVVYGEAYGGSCQGMSRTYGKELRFVAFEVKIGETFLNVPSAQTFCDQVGLPFVHWVETSTDMDALNAQRDMPSVQSSRNGVSDIMPREGIVLRPPFEVVNSRGDRVMAKHKGVQFSERKTPDLEAMDPAKRQILEQSSAIAEEWVTPMRLVHVMDRLKASREEKDLSMTDTPFIIKLMVEDVTREAAGEIIDSPDVRKQVGSKAAQLFKKHFQDHLTAKA